MGAAVLFLAAYAWPILEPGLPAYGRHVCAAVTWATWAVFAVDYVVRLVLAPDRGLFVVRNLFDLAVVALPLLRPLRLLRLVLLLRVVNRRAAATLHGRIAAYVAGGAVLLGFVGALAVLDAERTAQGSNITDFPTAAWWALTTMATVGYGDHYPVTGAGRLAAGGLMVGGIALLGAVTATFASWLVERVAEDSTTNHHLHAEIVELRSEIRALAERLGAGAGSERG